MTLTTTIPPVGKWRKSLKPRPHEAVGQTKGRPRPRGARPSLRRTNDPLTGEGEEHKLLRVSENKRANDVGTGRLYFTRRRTKPI